MEMRIGYGLQRSGASDSQFTTSMHFSQYKPFVTVALRRWVLICLMITLPLCGFASAVTALLGAQHFHLTDSMLVIEGTNARAEPVLLRSVEVWFQPARKPLFAHAVAVQAAHVHDSVQRHHHDSSTDHSSVVRLDGGTSYDAARAELDTASSKAGAGLLPLLGWMSESNLSDAITADAPWGEAPRWSVQSAELRSSERPPKT